MQIARDILRKLKLNWNEHRAVKVGRKGLDLALKTGFERVEIALRADVGSYILSAVSFG